MCKRIDLPVCIVFCIHDKRCGRLQLSSVNYGEGRFGWEWDAKCQSHHTSTRNCSTTTEKNEKEPNICERITQFFVQRKFSNFLVDF